jgi:hypothetical protein
MGSIQTEMVSAANPTEHVTGRSVAGGGTGDRAADHRRGRQPLLLCSTQLLANVTGQVS